MQISTEASRKFQDYSLLVVGFIICGIIIGGGFAIRSAGLMVSGFFLAFVMVVVADRCTRRYKKH
jgi:hypothetical protein